MEKGVHHIMIVQFCNPSPDICHFVIGFFAFVSRVIVIHSKYCIAIIEIEWPLSKPLIMHDHMKTTGQFKGWSYSIYLGMLEQ